MNAKILMALAKGVKDGRRAQKVGDGLVVGARDMAQHERLEGSIVDQPYTIAFGISGRVGLRIEAVQPICEPFFVRDE
jgi:hypothetical protein